MTTVQPKGTVRVSPPSRNPLKLSAPFRPVSPATSWDDAVLVTVSACNQYESTTGSAPARACCAPAVTGRTTMATTHRNLTIGTSWGGDVTLVTRLGAPFATKIRSRSGSPQPGNVAALHARLRQPEDEDRVAQRITDLEVAPRRDGDELLAVELEHRGCGVHSCTAVELPQDRAGLGVVRLEPAVALAREHQAASRGGRAAHHREVGLLLPGDLPRVQVDRADGAVLTRVAAFVIRDPDEGAPEPQPTLLPRGVMHFVMHGLMQPHRVRIREVGMHRDRRPFLAAVRARKHEHPVGGGLRVHGLLRHERLRAADQLAGRGVEHIHEAGLSGLDH